MCAATSHDTFVTSVLLLHLISLRCLRLLTSICVASATVVVPFALLVWRGRACSTFVKFFFTLHITATPLSLKLLHQCALLTVTEKLRTRACRQRSRSQSWCCSFSRDDCDVYLTHCLLTTALNMRLWWASHSVNNQKTIWWLKDAINRFKYTLIFVWRYKLSVQAQFGPISSFPFK